MDSGRGSEGDAWRRRASLGVLVGMCVAVYANSLGGAFHFDDTHYVVENPAIGSLANVGRFFTDASTFSVLSGRQNYRPVLLVSYALTAAVAGIEARAFLLVNLLVHLACVLLLYAAFTRLGALFGGVERRLVWLGAALFAVHPLFSECVNYVSARSESLSAAFALASLVAYLRHRESKRRGWLVASAACIVAGVLTKPVVAPLPLFFIAVELAVAERAPWREAARRAGVVIAAAVAATAFNAAMTPAVAFAEASDFTVSQYVRSVLPALMHYIGLFIWPLGQSADPDFPVTASWLEPRVVAAGVALAAALLFSVQGLLRRQRVAVSLAIVWFFLCLSVATLFPLAEIANEHRPYLALAGFCPLAAALLLRLGEGALRLDGVAARRATAIGVLLVLSLLSGLTFARNRVWATEESLWQDVASGAPRSARAQMNYGLTLMRAGKLDEAESYLRDATRLAPRYAYAHVNLGQWLLARGESAEAERHFDEAVNVAPNLFVSHYYRGLAAELLGESAELRVRTFEKAVTLSPGFAEAHYHLALAFDAKGELSAAKSAAEKAVALRSSFDNRFMLAYVMLRLQDARGALPLLQELRRERPTDSRVAWNLSEAERQLAPPGE
jgi:protein O-mannosyl-transferase